MGTAGMECPSSTTAAYMDMTGPSDWTGGCSGWVADDADEPGRDGVAQPASPRDTADAEAAASNERLEMPEDLGSADTGAPSRVLELALASRV